MASAIAPIPPVNALRVGLARVTRSTNVTLAQPRGGRLTGSKPSPGYIGSQLLPGHAPSVSLSADRVQVPANVF